MNLKVLGKHNVKQTTVANREERATSKFPFSPRIGGMISKILSSFEVKVPYKNINY